MTSASPSINAPPRNWRSLLAAVCFAQATAIVGFDFTLPFIPLYLQHDLHIHGVGATALWAGLIGFGPAIPATIFGPLWGKLADRFGYRAMLLRAMACACILLSLMGLAPNAWVLLALRMFQGALTGTIFSAQALVASSVPEEETARSMGLLQMSVFVGATVGPLGGGAISQIFGYRSAFLAAGILLASATAIVYTFVSEPKRQSSPTTVVREPRPSMLSVLRIPAFAGAILLTFVVQLANTSLFPIIPLFVQDLLGTTQGVATHTGWLLAVSGIVGALGSYVGARFQRRIGLKPLAVISILLSAALVIPQAFSANFLVFLILRSLAAFAVGSLLAVVGTLAAKSSPRDAKGAAFGLVGAASSLGFGAGPLLGGTFAASFGIRPVFVASGILLAIIPLYLLAAKIVTCIGRRVRPVAHAPERRGFAGEESH